MEALTVGPLVTSYCGLTTTHPSTPASFAWHWPPCGDGSFYFLHLHGYHKDRHWLMAGRCCALHVWVSCDICFNSRTVECSLGLQWKNSSIPLGERQQDKINHRRESPNVAAFCLELLTLYLGLLDLVLSLDLLTLCLDGMGLFGSPGMLFCMSLSWSRAPPLTLHTYGIPVTLLKPTFILQIISLQTFAYSFSTSLSPAPPSMVWAVVPLSKLQ